MINSRLHCSARVSRPVESAPWGYDSPNRFVNVGLVLTSDCSPESILQILQGIERDMGSGSHRSVTGTYADRIIDIDIIAVDEMIISTSELTIPHPHMAQRRFVLEPMAEIAPHWTHPILHKTASQLLLLLQD